MQHLKDLKEEEAKALDRLGHQARLHEKEISLREQKVGSREGNDCCWDERRRPTIASRASGLDHWLVVVVVLVVQYEETLASVRRSHLEEIEAIKQVGREGRGERWHTLARLSRRLARPTITRGAA